MTADKCATCGTALLGASCPPPASPSFPVRHALYIYIDAHPRYPPPPPPPSFPVRYALYIFTAHLSYREGRVCITTYQRRLFSCRRRPKGLQRWRSGPGLLPAHVSTARLGSTPLPVRPYARYVYVYGQSVSCKEGGQCVQSTMRFRAPLQLISLQHTSLLYTTDDLRSPAFTIRLWPMPIYSTPSA